MKFWVIHIILLFILIGLLKYLVNHKYKKSWVIITLLSGVLVGGVSIYNLLAYLAFEPTLDKNSQIDSIIRISLPLVTSIITALSIILATQNANTGERAAKRGRVLDLIKFTNDIIKDNDISSKSNKILKQLESYLKSNKTKLDILVNNGALFCFNYLNTNDNRKKILIELKKLEYEEDSIYFIKQKELIYLINSSDIKDMRKLWILINFLSGKPAVRHNILEKESEYELDKDWIGKGLIKHSFYSNTILKSNRNILRDFIIAHSKHDYSSDLIRYEEIYRACDSFFKTKYTELGHFFRTFHRTLKLINIYYSKDSEEYRMQIGLLRAQIPNSVATILFYNAFYTDLGRGMGRELIKSNFFGNKDDFQFNTNESNTYKSLIRAQHFYDIGKLLSDQNAYICYEIFTENKDSIKISNNINNVNEHNKFTKRLYESIVNVVKKPSNNLTLTDDLIEYNFTKENQYLFNVFQSNFKANSKGYPEQFKLFTFDKQNNQ